jgi:hypothetical protein
MKYNFYRYFFYRLYIWYLRKTKVKNLALHFGVAIPGYLIMLNLITLNSLFELLFGFDSIKDHSLLCCIFVLVMFATALNFTRSRVEGIQLEFKNESKRKRLNGSIMMWSYVFGSIIFAMLIATLARNLEASHIILADYFIDYLKRIL